MIGLLGAFNHTNLGAGSRWKDDLGIDNGSVIKAARLGSSAHQGLSSAVELIEAVRYAPPRRLVRRDEV
jgi:hypothetical protein